MRETDLTFESFSADHLPNLYKAFIETFASNAVRFQPSRDQFEKRILNKLHIHPELSLVSRSHNDIVGFVLHAICNNQGVTTAYNGGTGVVPDRQGKGLASRMYDALLPAMVRSGVNNILLEVITSNQPALGLYRSIGFQYTRTFKCFKLLASIVPKHAPDIELSNLDINNGWRDLDRFWSFMPAWLDRSAHLPYNAPYEQALGAIADGHLLGYVVFQPTLGRVSQIAVAPASRGKGIGRRLLFEAQRLSANRPLTIMNIPEEETATIDALTRIGFVNQVDQFEMELII